MALSWRPNGNLVVTIRLTLRPGRDDELIALVLQAPKGALAGLVREAMRSGIPKDIVASAESHHEPSLELSGLGMDL